MAESRQQSSLGDRKEKMKGRRSEGSVENKKELLVAAADVMGFAFVEITNFLFTNR
jgi:hypothetical protein